MQLGKGSSRKTVPTKVNNARMQSTNLETFRVVMESAAVAEEEAMELLDEAYL